MRQIARGPLLLWVLAALLSALYLVLAPAIVNGDGLGYLKASCSGELYPGHLAYVPLLRGLRAACGVGPRPIDGLAVARALDAVAGGVAALGLGLALLALGGSLTRAAIATLGFGVSSIVVIEASDVESYAPALACITLALWLAVRRSRSGGRMSVLLATLALSASALFHVENVLFAGALALILPKRDRAFVLFGAATIVSVAYASAISTHGFGWLHGASHGFSYPLHVWTPAVAVAGAAKTLVYAPYLYEASFWLVAVHTALGVFALVALAALVCSRAPESMFDRATLLAWAVPYTAVGCAFFASDAERWIFLLPLGWLLAATSARKKLALVLILALAVANVTLWWPRVRDDDWIKRAGRAGLHLRDGDLLISPGHGWDEYVGVYEGPSIVPLPLVFFAGKLGSRSALREKVARACAQTRAGGHRIFLARMNEAPTSVGWKELTFFGIAPATVRALLPAGAIVPRGDGVAEVEP